MSLAFIFPSNDGLAVGDSFVRPAEDFDADATRLLNGLRMVALACRCTARANVSDACKVLSQDQSVATNAFAEFLVRCLAQVLDRIPHFNRPGVDELSFDEQWLMRLILCHHADDVHSIAFLMQSRVPQHAQGNLCFLIGAVAEHLDSN
ncbi:MAG: hypothetical protein AAGK02_00120 [Pseudomonadota bacterium]